jgi:hypothetical protein
MQLHESDTGAETAENRAPDCPKNSQFSNSFSRKQAKNPYFAALLGDVPNTVFWTVVRCTKRVFRGIIRRI